MKRQLTLILGLIFYYQFTFAQIERLGEAIDLYDNQEYNKALEILVAAKDQAKEQLSDPELASFYVILGNAYYQTGQEQIAEIYYLSYRMANRRYVRFLADSSQALLTRGNQDQAVEVIESALERARLNLDESDEASLEISEKSIKIFESSGRLDRAETVSGKLCQIYGNQGDLINFNKISIDYARVLEKTGNLQLADKVYNHFLTNTPKYLSKDNPYYIRIIADYAMSLHLRKEYVESINPFLVLEQGILAGMFVGENAANIYNNLGLGLKEAERYDEALERYKKALTIRQEIREPGHIDIAQSHLNLGILYENMEDYANSVYHLGQAVTLYHNTEKQTDFDNAYDHYYPNLLLLTKELQNRGDDTRLLDVYLEMLRMETGLKTRLSHWFGISISLLTNIYTHQDRLTDLEQLYIDLAEMYKTRFGENSNAYITALIDLAQVYELSGRFMKAGEIFNHAAESAQNTMGEKGEEYAYATGHLGIFISKSGGDEQVALQKLKETVSLYKSLGLNETKRMWYLTFLHSYAGLLQPGDEAFGSVMSELIALPIDTSNRNWTANTIKRKNMLAIMHMKSRDFQSAVRYNEEALKLARSAFDENDLFFRLSLPELAYAHLLAGNFDRSIALLEEVRELNFNYINKNRAFLSEDELGKLYTTISSHLDNYNYLVLKRYFTDSDRIIKMFEGAVFTKGLLFNNSKKLLSSVLAGSDEDLKNLVNQLRWKREELVNPTDSSASADVIEQQILGIEKEISAKSNRAGQLFGSESVNWRAIRDKLKEDEALVEIVRVTSASLGGEDDVLYGMMVLRKASEKGPDLEVISGGSDLEGKYLSYFRNMIGIEEVDTLSYSVYWQPLEKHLSGVRKVFLSPDGIYNLISLPSLFDAEQNTYLLDKYELSIISNSGDLLARSDERFLAQGKVDLFGFPDYNYSTHTAENAQRSRIEYSFSEVSPIPGTLAEIEEIERMLNEKQVSTVVHKSANASERSVKTLASPGVLHIATHGFFQPVESDKRDLGQDEINQAHPLLKSGLLLSEGGGEDGILTGYEANNLDLRNTSLVVLSACETGLGDVRYGEGVYGLPRAFRSAGAQSVLMSLWKVNDEATKDLMIAFYSGLYDNKGVVESLREAQLKIRQKYNHPYYWGSFVLTEGW